MFPVDLEEFKNCCYMSSILKASALKYSVSKTVYWRIDKLSKFYQVNLVYFELNNWCLKAHYIYGMYFCNEANSFAYLIT